MVINAFAKSLEIIPRTLAENAGLDSNEVISKLRQRHQLGETFAGVDVWDELGVCNAFERFIWEPLVVKKNYIASASEAACMIITIDETVKAPQNEEDKKMRKQALPGNPMMKGGKPPGMKLK